MAIEVFMRLIEWLDRRGDLLCVSAKIFAFGPLLLGAGLILFFKQEIGVGLVFWTSAILCLLGWTVYYTAFILALARQRERFYQREVKPTLSREYRDE